MSGGRARTAMLGCLAIVALSGCELRSNEANLVNGKTLFVEKCSQCHALARANAQGVVGPNLDQAFQRAVADGFERSTFEGMVHRQIKQPNQNVQVDPNTGKPLTLMPKNLVTGQDAYDVAAYVASAAAAPGEDQGLLAQAGAAQAEGTAKAEGGKLDIPVGTGLAYKFADAEAPAGKIEIDSVNDQSTDHNIAIEGNGVNEVGDVVNNGGTSTVTADLKPGTYTFFCTVDGHRQAGMEGKLTIK
jgi:plastocyanin